MVYHSICVHQIQKCIIVYRHKGFSKWWICPEASFPSSEWTNRIIQGNKWRQAILSFVGLHHWLAAVSLLNTQNLCVVSCRFAKCRTVLLFIENILRPQAMAMCCISHEAWLCHTCSIRQSRHMLTWEVNSQVIHRLCCFLLQAKPVRLQHSIARCCTMHGGFNPPCFKTLSEDYDNQTRACQKHGFSSPKFMFHCRWVHLTRNAWRLETKGIKMPLTLSSSLRCSIFFYHWIISKCVHFVSRSVSFRMSSYIGRETELYPPRLLTSEGIFPDPMNENTNYLDKYGNTVIQ